MAGERKLLCMWELGVKLQTFLICAVPSDQAPLLERIEGFEHRLISLFRCLLGVHK